MPPIVFRDTGTGEQLSILPTDNFTRVSRMRMRNLLLEGLDIQVGLP